MSSDPFGIEKSNKQKDNIGGAVTAGAGATTAGVGLIGGGLPGAKVNSAEIKNVRSAAKAGRGGITGFRHAAHGGGVVDFKNQRNAAPHKAKNAKEAFYQGYNEGKIKPEIQIMRHMKNIRRASNAALIGGTAATAFGVKRMKQNSVSKSRRDLERSDRRAGAALGAGGAAAVLTHGAARQLRGQEYKWSMDAAHNVDQSAKIAPRMGGRRGDSIYPKVGEGEPGRNPKLLSDVGRRGAKKVGRMRGAAKQQRHFAEVYGRTAKVVEHFRKPSLAVAGVGAGVLGANEVTRHRQISKSRLMSDAEIKRRKKLQGKISQTTSTLGLGALAGLGAAAALKRGKLAKVPRVKNWDPVKVRENSQNAALVSGGVGGLGGYNFAAYTNAESRKRKQLVAKNDPPSPFEDGFYGVSYDKTDLQQHRD